jgi:DNA-binding transcriptional LysR family regulator
VRDFRAKHPLVQVHLHQGTPHQVATTRREGQADTGIATEALAQYPDRLALLCYRWTPTIVVPPGHPLDEDRAAGRTVSLQRPNDCPLITCGSGYTGRSHIDDAFAKAALKPDIVLVAIRRGSYLRDCVCEFITSFAPPLSRPLVQRALQSAPVTELDLQKPEGRAADGTPGSPQGPGQCQLIRHIW